MKYVHLLLSLGEDRITLPNGTSWSQGVEDQWSAKNDDYRCRDRPQRGFGASCLVWSRWCSH